MTYQAEVLADSPLGYWPLGANAQDSSGNARHGTVVGSPTFGASGPGGDSGVAGFTTSDYITLPSAAYVPGAFTWEGWAKTSSSGWAFFLAVSTSAGLLGVNGASGMPTYVEAPGSNHDGSATISDGAWHHVVITRDAGGTLLMYRDGVQIGSWAATGAPASSTVYVGASSAPGDPWTGSLARVAIYPAALTSTRISAHYAAGVSAVTGSTAGSMAAFTGSLSGTSAPPARTGALAGSMAAFTGSLSGAAASVTGSLAGTMDAFTGSLTGTGIAYVGNLNLADAILYNGTTYDSEIHPPVTTAQFAWDAATVTLNPTGIAAKPGIYSSNGAGNDSKAIEVIGQAPMIANEYLQVGDASHRGQVSWGSYRNIVSSQSPRLTRGTDVLLAFSYKGYYGDGRDNSNIGLRVVAQGPSHPDYDDMVQIWDDLCDRAETLAMDFPERIVWLGLPEGEVDAKVNKYLNALAGDRVAATTAEAGQAWDFLLARGKSRAPHVRFALWFAGTQTTLIHQVMAQVTTRPHVVIGDPYTNGSAIETLEHCFNDWLDWLRADSEFVRLSGLGDGTALPCGIGEFGMETPAHTDAQVKTYLTGMHQTLINCGLEFAVWFDSDRDKGHVITNGSYPQSCAQFNTELSLARAAPVAFASYTFTIIGRVLAGVTTPSLDLYTTTDLDDPDAATWTSIGHVDTTAAEGDIVTLVLDVGPGVGDWDTAVALAQQVAWETDGIDVLAASWSGAPMPDPDAGVIPDEDDLTGGPVLTRPTPTFDSSFVADMPLRVIVPVTAALA